MADLHCVLAAGDDAFQPHTYGRTVTVQRRITASGSSTWKLSDQDGRKVWQITFARLFTATQHAKATTIQHEAAVHLR
jgi:hypothetical protein